MQSLNRLLTSTRTVVKDLSDVPPTREEFAKAMEIAKQIKLPAGLKVLQGKDSGFLSSEDLIVTQLTDRDYAGKKGFVLFKVDTDEEVQRVLKGVSSERRWEYSSWLDSGYKDRATSVLSVQRENIKTREGFAAYRRSASIELHDDMLPVLTYTLNLDSVFVRPQSRGKSVSSALRRAIMEDVLSDVPYIAETHRKLSEKYDLLLSYRVEADTITEEGERFADYLSENLNETVEAHHTPEEISSFPDRSHGVAVEMAY